MKKAIFVLMLIVATFAAKQGNGQAKLLGLSSVTFKPSVPVSIQAKPPVFIGDQPKLSGLIHLEGPKRWVTVTNQINPDNTTTTTTTTTKTNSDGTTTTTTTTTTVTNQSDGNVPPGTVISESTVTTVLDALDIIIRIIEYVAEAE